MRYPPAIGTNTTWDCGQCIVGYSCEKVFSYQNTGGQCNFKVLARTKHTGGEDADDDGIIKKPMSEHCVSPGSFCVSPRAGFVSAGGKWEFSVQFQPNQTGPLAQEFSIVCDEGTVSLYFVYFYFKVVMIMIIKNICI